MSLHIPIPAWDENRRNPGVVWVDADELTRNERSDAARMMNAVGKVLANTDPDATWEFEGMQIGTYLVVADPYLLEEMAEAGEFTFDQFYWDSRSAG